MSGNGSARRLRLFLRDHRILHATARVPDGHDLAGYLATRDRYFNLVDVEWVGTRAGMPYMALRVDTVLWASSEDGALPLVHPGGEAVARRVEAEVEGGYLLLAALMPSPKQRLSDYLRTAPGFVPFRGAELRPRGTRLGDIAVNQGTIQAVREIGEARG